MSERSDKSGQEFSIWQELKTAWKHDYKEADWEAAVRQAGNLDRSTAEGLMCLGRLFDYRGSTHENFAGLRYGEPNRLNFDPAAGDRIIAKAGSYQKNMPGFMQGLNSLHRFKWHDASEQTPVAFKTIAAEGRVRLRDKKVIVASCDVQYFQLFAEDYVQSLRAFNIDLEIVILLVSHDSLPEAKKLVERYNGVAVWYTAPEHCCRSQFANARFFGALKVLEEGADVVYVADIDSRFKSPMQHFHHALKGHKDYPALKIQKPIRFPWYYAMANFIYLPNTAESKRFLRGVCGYIESLYRLTAQDTKLWYSDQNALILGLANLQTDFVRVGNQIFKNLWHQYGATNIPSKSPNA